MILSIAAGILIAVGAIVYLTVGNICGAILFSMGLLTILCLKLNLFTGKAGLYATKEITLFQLVKVWVGNFIGTLIAAILILMTPRGQELSILAAQIVDIKLQNGFIVNLIYGIFCGLLMFMAVKTWICTNGNPIYAIMPVAIFILCGFNHCVADMFYLHLTKDISLNYFILLPTTIVNFIGCNILPWSINHSSS